MFCRETQLAAKSFVGGNAPRLKDSATNNTTIMDKERKYVCTIANASRAINGSAKIALQFGAMKELVKDSKGKVTEKSIKSITIADKNGNDIESDTITLSYRNFLKGITGANLPMLKNIVTLICGGNPRKYSKVQNICIKSLIGAEIAFTYQHLVIGDKNAAEQVITKPMWQMSECTITNAKDTTSEDIAFINMFGGFIADCNDKGMTAEETTQSAGTKLAFMS